MQAQKCKPQNPCIVHLMKLMCYTTQILNKVIKMKSSLKVWKKFEEEINNYLVLTKAG